MAKKEKMVIVTNCNLYEYEIPESQVDLFEKMDNDLQEAIQNFDETFGEYQQ
jgi:hypothetical protein